MNKLANKVSFKCNFLICPIPACLYPSEQIPILSLFGEDTKLYSNNILIGNTQSNILIGNTHF